MLADFYIPGLSNDIKIAVQKNNLVGQICYRSLDPVKNGVKHILLAKNLKPGCKNFHEDITDAHAIMRNNVGKIQHNW